MSVAETRRVIECDIDLEQAGEVELEVTRKEDRVSEIFSAFEVMEEMAFAIT